jgi:gluconate 5-dehydrogenase
MSVSMGGALHRLFDLSGRVALVTGGSRGLGLQIAEGLGEYGATLALAARNEADLDQAVAHLAGLGITAHAFVADLADPAGAASLVSEILARLGRIDILVNNAGTAWGAPAEEHSQEAWLRVMDVNLNGVFYLSQAVGRAWMIPNLGGRIVNIASVAGLKGPRPGSTGTIAYSTSKGGVVNLTRALAAEWGKYNITVNALAPGWFPSKMTRGTLEKRGDALAASAPLGRLGGPHDLKGAALLFASDASAHITGQILAIDGGTIAT